MAASRPTSCGFCGCPIREGEPVQVIRIGGLSDRIRCARDAQGPMDLDAIEASKHGEPVKVERATGFVRAGTLRPVLDRKLKAANDD